MDRKVLPRVLIHAYVVYQHVCRQVGAHVGGHRTGTGGVTAVKASAGTVFRTGRGETPGAADCGVE